MEILIASYVAGLLTVLAPCILPLLPVIVGGSILDNTRMHKWCRVLIIVSSLVISVVIFTFLLKVSTSLIGVPQFVWNLLSGLIVLLFGLSILLPSVWEKISHRFRFQQASSRLMQKSANTKSPIKKDILLGASLGPVFSSCSPTYALIIAIVLPESLFRGSVYLIVYALGLGSAMLAIAYFGQTLVSKLGWLSNPSNLFRKIIGALFVLVGIAVIFGFDRDLQTFIINRGWYEPIKAIEDSLY